MSRLQCLIGALALLLVAHASEAGAILSSGSGRINLGTTGFSASNVGSQAVGGTLCAWVFQTTAEYLAIFSIGGSAAANAYGQWIFYITPATKLVLAFRPADSGTYYQLDQSAAAFSTNAWHHICVVSHRPGHWLIYVDGVSKAFTMTNGTDDGWWYTDVVKAATANYTLAMMNQFQSGSTWASGYGTNSTLAEVAGWKLELTATEIGSLVKGASPRQVRPGILGFYYDLTNTAAVFDWFRRLAATPSLTSVNNSAIRPTLYKPIGVNTSP